MVYIAKMFCDMPEMTSGAQITRETHIKSMQASPDSVTGSPIGWAFFKRINIMICWHLIIHCYGDSCVFF